MVIKAFTKPVIPDLYEAGTALSVHLSLVDNGGKETELNQGFGILFPKGVIRKDNTISPRYAINPRIGKKNGEYFIICDCVSGRKVNAREENYITPSDVDADTLIEAEGDCDEAENRVFVWSTKDFVTFTELGECDGKSCDLVNITSNSASIDDAIVRAVTEHWMPLHAVGVKTPYSEADIDDEKCDTTKVTVEYSDETTEERSISWKKTEFGHEGTILLPEYKYPLIKGFADPVFFKWEGKWYFLATNDLNGNIGLFLREADSIAELFTEKASVSVILDYSEEDEFIQTFWAPEWHVIGGIPYILFAVGGHKWAPQCHIMRYKMTGSIMDPCNWEKPVRIKKKDGSFLTDGISLDMTYFKAGGTSYVVWSERYNIGNKLDTGSMLMIATVDEGNPGVLTSDKVLLSRPVYGWENVAGTINNEGPYALKSNGKVYLAYSGGAATGHTYAVGYLIADENKDLTDISNWTKYPTAVLSAYSLDGIDGPGHNSFFVDDDGNTMVAYHGQLDVRSSMIHRVHFGKDGFPYLNVGPERDIPVNLRTVSINS